jgi:hypothetical protein
LPGTYSLSPQSLDEQISRDVLLQRLPDVPAPALVIVVVDASNLERNLYFASQVIELGWPTIVALNMVDVAEKIGQNRRGQARRGTGRARRFHRGQRRRRGAGIEAENSRERPRSTDQRGPRNLCDLPPACPGSRCRGGNCRRSAAGPPGPVPRRS